MGKLIDTEVTSFAPDAREAHHSITLGAGVYVPYIPPGATKIMLQALAKAARYTLDGTTPATAVGFQLAAAATPITIPISSTTKLQIIREENGTILEYCIGK